MVLPTNSLYALAISKVQPEAIIQLKDHFRSCADIIEFSNRTFYDGSLRTATKYDTLKVPHGESSIRWINTSGETVRPNTGSAYNTAEVREVVKAQAPGRKRLYRKYRRDHTVPPAG